MDGFLHQVFAGLATGCIYGSIALALVIFSYVGAYHRWRHRHDDTPAHRVRLG